MALNCEISKYVDAFIRLLENENHGFNKLGEDDKTFCQMIYEEYDKAIVIRSGLDVTSFHLITKLNTFIEESLKKQNSFNIEENSGKLSSSYYELLRNEFIRISNPKDKFQEEASGKKFDKITWIKDILLYIDNQCNLLSFSSHKAYNDAMESIVSTDSKVVQAVKSSKKALQIAKDSSKNSKATQSKIETFLNDAKDLSKEMRNTSSEIVPHMLTSLGIFVSIIIAVVSVYLSDLVSIHGDNGHYLSQLQLGRYLMSGQIIFNIIFLMLYIIARLTNKNILLHCSYYDPKNSSKNLKYRPCVNCKKKDTCNFFVKLWKKATYMVGMNLVCFAGYYVLFNWWIIEIYIWPSINLLTGVQSNISNNNYSLTFGIVTLLVINILMAICVFVIVRVMNKKLKKVKDA